MYTPSFLATGAERMAPAVGMGLRSAFQDERLSSAEQERFFGTDHVDVDRRCVQAHAVYCRMYDLHLNKAVCLLGGSESPGLQLREAHTRLMTSCRNFHPDLPRALATINVGIVGRAGAGKSTLINSIRSILTDGDLLQSAVAADGQGRITDKMTYYPVRYRDGEPSGIRIVDTPGFDRRNYKDGQLQLAVDGYVPTSLKDFDLSRILPRDLRPARDIKIQERLHVVIFVIPAKDLEQEMSDWREETFRLIAEVRAREWGAGKHCLPSSLHDSPT